MTNPSPEKLAPAALQPETPATPDTREAVMYDPKRILANLEKRMRDAVSQEEKDNIQTLVNKLTSTLASKSEQTVEGTRGVLASLKEQLPVNARKMLEEAQGIVPVSAEKGLEAGGKVAKETAVQAREMGEKAINAIKSGNVDEAKKLAEGVKETVNAAGQKVREISGSAAIDKILAPLRENGILGIFAVLGNLMKFISGGMKWTEVVSEAQTEIAKKWSGAIATAKEKIPEIQDALSKWTQEAQKFLLDKDYRNGLIEKSLPAMHEQISKEFFEGGNLSPKQKNDLKEVLQNAHFGQDTVAKIKDRLEKGSLDLAKASDLSDLFIELAFGNVNVLWELVSRGVIPLSRVAVHTVEAGLNSYRFNVGVVFHRLHLPNPPFISLSSDELAAKMQMANADPKLKEFLMVEMYRVNGFMAGVLGTVAGLSASMMNALLVDTSTKVDGIKMFQANFSGKYDALLKDIEVLEKAVLSQNVGGVEKGMAQHLKDHFAQVKQNFSVLAQLKADPTNVALKNQVKMMADPFKLRNAVGQLLGTKAGIVSEYLDSLYEIQKYQVAVAQKDILSRAKGLFGSFEILKMPRMADRFMLHFPSPESAKQTLQQMASYGPEFLQSFFRSLPVAGLVIAGYDVANSSESKNGSVADFVIEASKILVPFVGPFALFFSDTHWPSLSRNAETGNVEIKNMGTGFLAAGMLGVDSVMLANAIRSGKLMQFATGRITDVARFGGDVVKYSRAGIRGVEKLAPQIGKLMPLIANLPKKLKIAAIFALTLGGSTYAYAKSHTDIEKQLIKDGFWDARSENITPKLKERFAKMTDDEKRTFMDGLFVTFIENKETLPDTDSHFEKGVYTLITPKSADMGKVWDSLNAHETKFGEELRTLGIALNVAAKDAAPKQKAA